MQRIRAGHVLVRNPRNPSHVARVSLLADDVAAIVFWSRDYRPLLPHLAEIDDRGLPPCFHLTLTGLGPPLEGQTPDVACAIRQFSALSERYGRERIAWRYDPIIIGSHHTPDWHKHQFQELASRISLYASQAIISFLDLYPSTKRGLEGVSTSFGEEFWPPRLEVRLDLVRQLGAIGRQLGLAVRACCEPDLVVAGEIEQARCIDPEWAKMAARRADLEFKNAPTRRGCGCVYARDIGAYHCCTHGCVYCYANDSPEAARAGAGKIDQSANHLGTGFIEERAPTPKRAKNPAQLALEGLTRGDSERPIRPR